MEINFSDPKYYTNRELSWPFNINITVAYKSMIIFKNFILSDI